MPKSWKAEVIADNSGEWCSNTLRFATKEEAEKYGRDLASRWWAVQELRAVESEDEVTHIWHPVKGAVSINPDPDPE